MKVLQTRVLILGGGATGTGLARDLALRGVKCILAERRDINAGASGGNHGLLHSGARYVASDMEAAIECREEGEILKRLAPQCIEDTGGLFVAVEGDNEQYIADFQAMCDRSKVPARKLGLDEARAMEPVLSDKLIAAYEVEDAAVDPFMLSLDNLAHAMDHGAEYVRNARVVGFDVENGDIKCTRLRNERTGEEFLVEAEIVVNATGAWAGQVAELAGAKINILYSAGSLIVTQDRLTKRVVNRLRKAADADILVPGGTVSVLGTTSVTVDDPDHCKPTVSEVDRIIEDAKAMMPVLETTRYIRAYAGVRPLVLSGDAGDARNVSRGFSLIDHAGDNVDNFVTITGGKLTTYRMMAERTADMVCKKLGVTAPCLTAVEPLPASTMGRWTEPGLGPKSWIQDRNADDLVLCECEMVSRTAVNTIVENMGEMRGESMLQAIGLRSRVGKGPCQGGFCGLRITGHLYDEGHQQGQQGMDELRQFVGRRWRGFSPVLWGLGMVQADLQEALYCGALDLELDDDDETCGDE
ncbi:anaerobic glycerol-3-phosphate dehydrogenase subunit GlpA [Pseudodesulfovibrio sp. zrk46]|uniref:anaerobic glycerol-3-phosphate dehydrogenase subunit GlpA n=1 Tax=Pseudodesulfovibrio sp. zrk46 TaxID=2725288 RepID=UPI0014490A12|nr:anaerobic glycerol-3-phosphate dehydrogenase subunit GlpA [Pseudodesulfovibrio sp. zrk46]QJB57130.1 anaerobic glycerol-3-phosphate dehydrogenase subunit A [Pseudodesulfovibrio sp. zrk46]